MAAAAAHAAEAAAAAPGSAKTGAAAHAAKSAETAAPGRPRPTGRTRSARAAIETTAGAEVIVRAAGRTGASAPPPCAEPAKRPPEPAEGVAERGDKDKENCDEQDDISKHGENAADKAFPDGVVLLGRDRLDRGMSGLGVRAVGIDGPAAQSDPVHLCDGIGHIGGAGEDGGVVLLGGEVVLHGLHEGACLVGQHGAAEAVAVGQIVVAVGVLVRLHHQQDEHAVVLAGTADAPGVEGFSGVVLGGGAAGVVHGQHADLCAVAAGRELCVDGLELRGGAVAQHTGVVHHALIFRQAGQLDVGSRSRRGQRRDADGHDKKQCRNADG